MKVRGIVAAASPDEYGALANLIGDIKKLVNANVRWNDGSSNLAERSWVEDENPHDPHRASPVHVGSVVVAVLLRVDRATPSSVKAV